MKEAARSINKIKFHFTIIQELFEPTIETNRNSTMFMEETSHRFIKAFIKELRDPKKLFSIIWIVWMANLVGTKTLRWMLKNQRIFQ